MKTYLNVWDEDDNRQESYKNTQNRRICKFYLYAKLRLCCAPHRGCNKNQRKHQATTEIDSVNMHLKDAALPVWINYIEK